MHNSLNIAKIILIKLLPIYLIIVIGYIGNLFLNFNKETLSKLVIYVITPIVIFLGAYKIDIVINTLSLPLLFFTISTSMAILFLYIGKRLYKDNTAYILSFASGSGNTGYLGLPLILTIFGDKYLPIAVISTLGFIIYGNTIGYYLTARGRHNKKESIKKLLTLPSIYTFILGIIFNIFKIKIPPLFIKTLYYFKDSYIILGMMIIGISISNIDLKNIDYNFLKLTFFAKFILWPIIITLIIIIDKNFFHIYNIIHYRVLYTLSIVPLAANTVIFATQFNVQINKISLAVILSTVFSLIYIPLFLTIFKII